MFCASVYLMCAYVCLRVPTGWHMATPRTSVRSSKCRSSCRQWPPSSAPSLASRSFARSRLMPYMPCPRYVPCPKPAEQIVRQEQAQAVHAVSQALVRICMYVCMCSVCVCVCVCVCVRVCVSIYIYIYIIYIYIYIYIRWSLQTRTRRWR
jgi:hypothetical protein